MSDLDVSESGVCRKKSHSSFLNGAIVDKKKCASPESNRGPNDGNVGFYH